MKDDFFGMGGSYIVDPKTGKRVLVERTADTIAPVEESPKSIKKKTPSESEE